MIFSRSKYTVGSSPRLWGTLKARDKKARKHRFIPTLVGNSFRQGKRSLFSSVHPHACGELITPTQKFEQGCGSSPRLWGTLQDRRDLVLRCRFIPTLVGNSLLSSSVHVRGPVHPHACGELKPRPPFLKSWFGSSPRLWGTRIAQRNHGFIHRFIPTLVGNSSGDEYLRNLVPVHPHACGELFTRYLA